MTILKNVSIDKPGTTNVLAYAYGTAVLGAGADVDIALPGFSDDAQVFAGYGPGLFVAGDAGFLLASYDRATGILNITSSNAADRNGVHYLIVD